MKHCARCNLDVDSEFCPTCGSLAKPIEDASARKGLPGQTFECAIWKGAMLGISIGQKNRAKFFSVRRPRVELVIDEQLCRAELSDNFWTTCPEIRTAVDEAGKNRLTEWIRKNGLLPPRESMKARGVTDRVVLEVIVPEERFRVRVAEGSGNAK
jgi:hypothetical protein